MKSYVTSYNGLFSQRSADVPAVERIEIPLIQRDYAQGRQEATVQRIREDFLHILHRAVTHDERVSLDFVYGDVEAGTLRPVDGQQRLTTLFLLHWYLAFRACRLNEAQGWKHFTYATRPSARLFCERLVECQPPPGIGRPSEWITDQPWYLYTWCDDPTIQSMLVMLDAIHERFYENDCVIAWDRLVDPDEPAISFHLLPIEKLGLGEFARKTTYPIREL
jgi:septum formation topological specificity factor MinE